MEFKEELNEGAWGRPSIQFAGTHGLLRDVGDCLMTLPWGKTPIRGGWNNPAGSENLPLLGSGYGRICAREPSGKQAGPFPRSGALECLVPRDTETDSGEAGQPPDIGP